MRMDGCVHPAAGGQRCCCQVCVTGSCGDFTLDGVKFRVVCRGNLEIGLESDTQVGIDNISFRIKTTFLFLLYISLIISHLCYFSLISMVLCENSVFEKKETNLIELDIIKTRVDGAIRIKLFLTFFSPTNRGWRSGVCVYI